MPHYALFAPAYIGHLNPLFVLARALKRRGHRVTVLSPPVAAARVQQAGFDEVILYFNLGLKPHQQGKDEMSRFMEEVAPKFS